MVRWRPKGFKAFLQGIGNLSNYSELNGSVKDFDGQQPLEDEIELSNYSELNGSVKLPLLWRKRLHDVWHFPTIPNSMVRWSFCFAIGSCA